MILTMEAEYQRQSELLPSPERLEKVCGIFECDRQFCCIP